MFTLLPESPLTRGFQIFRFLGLRHLPIVDKRSVLRGMLARDELTEFKLDELNVCVPCVCVLCVCVCVLCAYAVCVCLCGWVCGCLVCECGWVVAWAGECLVCLDVCECVCAVSSVCLCVCVGAPWVRCVQVREGSV